MFAQRLAGGEAVETKLINSNMFAEMSSHDCNATSLNNLFAFYLMSGIIKHPHLVSWFHITFSLMLSICTTPTMISRDCTHSQNFQ